MVLILKLTFIFLTCYGVSTSDIEDRVLNGQPTQSNHLVRLLIKQNYNEYSLCSGSIISSFWILTAAHCFSTKYDEVTIDQLQDNESLEYVHIGFSQETVIHPKYKGETNTDIALVRSYYEIIFDETTNPIELPSGSINTFRFEKLVVTGYGESDFKDIVTTGSVTVAPCFEGRNVLCSYGKVLAGKGDSGGSLQKNNYLIGVTSAVDCYFWNWICFTLYVDVYSHRKWILDNIEST